MWFREHFPYYHGSCDYCQCGGDKEKIEKVYLGQMCASDAEDREGGARRTELYLCTNCNMITRFPRYRGLRNVGCHGHQFFVHEIFAAPSGLCYHLNVFYYHFSFWHIGYEEETGTMW